MQRRCSSGAEVRSEEARPHLREGERGADAHLARVLVEHAAVQRALHLAAFVPHRHPEVCRGALTHVCLAHGGQEHVEQGHAHRPCRGCAWRHGRALLEDPTQRAVGRGARAVVPPALLLEGLPRRRPPELLARSLRGSGVAAVGPRVMAAHGSAEERPRGAGDPPCLRCATRLNL